jgi:hypothetical protein
VSACLIIAAVIVALFNSDLCWRHHFVEIFNHSATPRQPKLTTLTVTPGVESASRRHRHSMIVTTADRSDVLSIQFNLSNLAR